MALLVGACASSSKPAGSTQTTSAGTGTGSASTAAVTGGSAVGITPTTITLGQIADITGPIPGFAVGTKYGTDAWAAYVNSTGGIDSRKVVFDHKDSALSCNAYTNAIEAVAKSTFAMVGSASELDACGAATLKANPEYPDVPAFIVNTAYASDPNVFSPVPQPPGWPTTGFLWIKNKFGAPAVQKFAALYSSATQMGFQETTAAAESVGYKLVYSRAIGFSESNFTSDILRMKSDGVQVVDLTYLTVGQTADFEKQAAQQNFHPDAVTGFAYDHSLFTLLGNPSYADNMVFPLQSVLYLGEDAATVPEIGTMMTWLQKTHPGAPMSLYAFEGWEAGLYFEEAMKKAGTNPTQRSVLAGLASTTSFNANGMLADSNNPGQKIPSPCTVIVGVQGAKFVRIDPPTTSFLCNGTFHYYNGKS
jgi:ABC-type branched-subunit amino acid transport system substrate-binding protein